MLAKKVWLKRLCSNNQQVFAVYVRGQKESEKGLY